MSHRCPRRLPRLLYFSSIINASASSPPQPQGSMTERSSSQLLLQSGFGSDGSGRGYATRPQQDAEMHYDSMMRNDVRIIIRISNAGARPIKY
jgi:hypothetical protein